MMEELSQTVDKQHKIGPSTLPCGTPEEALNRKSSCQRRVFSAFDWTRSLVSTGQLVEEVEDRKPTLGLWNVVRS